jgi:hypothetical protein
MTSSGRLSLPTIPPLIVTINNIPSFKKSEDVTIALIHGAFFNVDSVK